MKSSDSGEKAEAIPPAQSAEQHLSNLLARIHRDGGHYEAQHGTEKAVEDADTKIAHLNALLAQSAEQDRIDAERWRMAVSAEYLTEFEVRGIDQRIAIQLGDLDYKYWSEK